jgi:2-polyprenyl-3-methyl-5-hydroxy-6-metoxy-1,4-benzoquinol methylase
MLWPRLTRIPASLKMTVSIDPEGNEQHTIHDLVDFTAKDVLEIGCGDGRLIWRYANMAATVLGLDSFEADIEHARRNAPTELQPKVTFRVADALGVDLSAESFDVVVLGRSI